MLAERVKSIMRHAGFDEDCGVLGLSRLQMVFCLAAVVVSSWFISQYLNFQPQGVVWLAVLALLLMSGARVLAVGYTAFRRIEYIGLALFAAAFSIALVLGEHIVLSGSTYTGLLTENYISPYGAIDVFAGLFIFAGVSLLSLAAFSLLKHGKHAQITPPIQRIEYRRIGLKSIILFALLLFLFWLPYLIMYWPGFIFGDTLWSFAQIVSGSYNNHHPVAFTLLIKACWKVANILGFGNAAGCALFCGIQMSFMAYCLGYFCRWVVARGQFPVWIGWLLVLSFGLCPYVATFSIALWKDPMFSVSLVILSLLLFDLVISRVRAARSPGYLLALVFVCLVTVFFRNNGVFVIALVFGVVVAAFVIGWARNRNKSNIRSIDGKSVGLLVGCMASCLVVFVVVAGPVYQALGVSQTAKVETLGIPLNQMARVAALEGDMTESDSEFMDSMLPLEKYATIYRPCCTDMLKWDSSFNGAPLSGYSWFKHWVSMFAQNPRVYFEAWELQTCGFWTVNVSGTYTESNIGSGVPRNVYEEFRDTAAYGIDVSAGYADDFWHDLFPYDSVSIPIGILLWVLIYLAVCLALLHRSQWIIALVPAFGLLLTLFVASPIWYWPRYGAAVQFLIPLYALLFWLLYKNGSYIVSPSRAPEAANNV